MDRLDDLSPDRWHAIKGILDAVLEAEPPEQPQLVEDLCGDDVALREEVEALIRAERQAPAFLDDNAVQFSLPLLPDPARELNVRIPESVGPYRLVREIGRGGMGTIYLGERSDGAFEQRVAVKLLRAGVHSEGALRRFLAEQRILAALEHPNIARLYDGGMTARGQPYFIMEYVEGLPIDVYCDRQELPIAARLRLFTEVCRAVEFAHRNLVVHRDLKPSNILVTGEGRVKLLDFGIAKLLDPGLAPADQAVTGTGFHVMTPEYASPEQVRGQAVTTASDVYQLGILLYELLCGRRPYQVPRRSPTEAARVICERMPSRPSTAITQVEKKDGSGAEISRKRGMNVGRLRQRLRGDLDTITLTALRKEPDRRYASAGMLADDIDRHLEGRPVSARPDTLRYRGSKFIQRHRAAVAVTAVLVIVALTASLLLARRITGERDAAVAAAMKAERVTEFLVELFEEADPYASEDPARRQAALLLLRPAVERLEEELRHEPDVQAHLMHTLGDVYARLGRPDRAAAMLRKALSLRRELYGAPHEDLARTLYSLGRISASADSAVFWLDRAAAMRRSLYRGDHPELAENLVYLAQAIPYGDPRKDEVIEEALAMLSRLYGARSAEVGRAYNEFTVGYQDAERAEAFYRRAIELLSEHYGEVHIETAEAMHNLGLVLDAEGRSDEGIPLLWRSYEIAQAVVGSAHPSTSIMAVNVGATLHEQGRYEEADVVLREALALRRQTLPDSSTAIADGLYWLGRNQTTMGNCREAETTLREAMAIYLAMDAEENFRHGISQHYLATCLIQRGRFSEAEHHLKQALHVLGGFFGEDHERTRAVRAVLSDLYMRWGRPEEAERYDVASR